MKNNEFKVYNDLINLFYYGIRIFALFINVILINNHFCFNQESINSCVYNLHMQSHIFELLLRTLIIICLSTFI